MFRGQFVAGLLFSLLYPSVTQDQHICGDRNSYCNVALKKMDIQIGSFNNMILVDDWMADCFVLFFALNSIYSVISGFCAGRAIQKLCALPIITAVFYLAGTWLFFDTGEKAFILYALVYLALGAAAMFISVILKRKP